MIRTMSRLWLLYVALARPAFALPHAGGPGGAMATDAHGRVYIVDTYRRVLWRVEPGGSRTALLHDVRGTMIAVAPDGTVYLPTEDVHDTFQWRVTIVTPAGAARDTVLTTTILVDSGRTVGADTAGIYFARGTELDQISWRGEVRTTLYRLPLGLDIAAAVPTIPRRTAVLVGNALVLSEGDSIGGDIVGDVLPGFADMGRTSARFDHPVALAIDRVGAMYVADDGNRRLRFVTYGGTASTLLHTTWPWRPTSVALSGDTAYVLERATGLALPGWAAGLLGAPRVQRVTPGGKVETVVEFVSWMARMAVLVLVALAGALYVKRSG
ncbi:MAG TPA: hypothetical protein VGI83_03245 [Gemmatimonadales bacterium]|jgi:hypothetical protein